MKFEIRGVQNGAVLRVEPEGNDSSKEILYQEQEGGDDRGVRAGRDLAALATNARPRLLVLYHQLLWGVAPDALVAEVKAGYPGRVVFGKDLDVF